MVAVLLPFLAQSLLQLVEAEHQAPQEQDRQAVPVVEAVLEYNRRQSVHKLEEQETPHQRHHLKETMAEQAERIPLRQLA